MDNFTDLSIELTKSLTKETKKAEGIFFTPSGLVKQIVDFVFEQKPDIRSVLEPSCGSGQFIEYLSEKKVNVYGVEKNKSIYLKLKFENVVNADFLKHQFTQTFGLVIGNPPYFVVPKNTVDKDYLKYFEGRPNIYILFIIKSFELLNENGILAFVLPTNFLNCIYYNELRKYLKDFLILKIEISEEKFLETDQEICTFVIQKTKKPNPFILTFGDIVLFKQPDQIEKIKELVIGSTTLSKLNCKMSVGKVVWNQCKKDLTDDPTKTLLIYCGDFKNNELSIQKYNDTSKKNYINKQGSTDTVLLVNRGYGTGKYKLNYLIVSGMNYLVENHCMVITHDNSSERMGLFNKIIQSFENPKTKEFIDLVFSNNAINIQEFMNILPIYL